MTDHVANGTPNGRPHPGPDPPEVGPGDPAAVAIQAAFARGVGRLRQCEPSARGGMVEGVHRMRASTRRLRSELRVFRGLIDAEWVDPLEAELQWMGGILGAVRDLDVLRLRLREAAAESLDALAPLFRTLEERHALASEALREIFLGVRYRVLLGRLDATDLLRALKDDAWEPCRSALPPLVADAWKVLKASGRALGPNDPDDEFHEVRIRAKRARYAAEAVAGALDEPLGKQARRFAKHATRVQDVLGEHQDAIVAGHEIERIVTSSPDDGPFNLAAGRLLERQACAASRARDQFFDVWDALDRRKNVRWFKV